MNFFIFSFYIIFLCVCCQKKKVVFACTFISWGFWWWLTMDQVSEAKHRGSTHMHSKPEDKTFSPPDNSPAIRHAYPPLSLSLSLSLYSFHQTQTPHFNYPALASLTWMADMGTHYSTCTYKHNSSSPSDSPTKYTNRTNVLSR